MIGADFISIARIIAGFVLAPVVGPCLYYLIFMTAQKSIADYLNDFSFIAAGALMGGLLFYPITVIIGLFVMLLMRRFYKWNILICIAGAIISAILVALTFTIILLINGGGVMHANVGFYLLLKLIFVPSVFAGISFWVITVYKNNRIEILFQDKPN